MSGEKLAKQLGRLVEDFEDLAVPPRGIALAFSETSGLLPPTNDQISISM